MNKFFMLATGGLIASALLGCGTGYPMGSIYAATQIPHGMSRNETSGAAKSGDKSGESCASGILSAIAWGDASLDAAKKAGAITEVHSVEFRGTNIIGIYQQGCTVVHGK